MRPVKQKKLQSGFTIIELLVCIAIFAILAGGVIGVFGAISRTTKVVREKVILSGLASDYLETIRNMPYSQVGTVHGNPNGTLPDSTIPYSQTISGTVYQIYYEVTYIHDPADPVAGNPSYKQVKVDILNTSTNQVTSFVTTVVPKGLISNPNDGVLQIQAINSQGNPVSGANITISYPTTSPTIILNRQTNSSGQWTEVGLPPAVNNYRVVVTEPGYSQDQTYPVSASNPNPVHPDATVSAGQITNITFSIDLLSSLNIKTLNQTCGALSGVNLNVLGAKLIGSNPNVVKFNNNYSSASGAIALNNIEWDTYTPTLLTGQSSIIYGTSPIQKIAVLPSTSQTYTMILGSNATANSLLVIVKDASSGAALENASVSLTDGGSYNQTLLTGGSVWLQNDWSGGAGQAGWSTSTPNKYFQDNGGVNVGVAGQVTLGQLNGSYSTTATGTLESSTFDTGTNATNYTILSWLPASQSASTTVAFQVAANNDNATWNYVGPDGTANSYFTTPGTDMGSILDDNEYFRYKVFLSTADPARTPTLTSTSVNFVTGCYTPGQVIFTGLNSQTYYVSVSMPGYQTQNNISVNVNGNQSWEADMTP